MVHCDLKAANILSTKTGDVKLTDFGVSLNLRMMQDELGAPAGTPNWMAPEVIELKGASTKSDIWSLGCTIIELLTGRPPYAGMIAMSALYHIVEDDHPPVPENASEVSYRTDGWLVGWMSTYVNQCRPFKICCMLVSKKIHRNDPQQRS